MRTHDVHLIAEVGSVHDGSLGNAHRLIDTAAEVGADAVKFQTHIAEAETLADAPAPAFFSAEPRVDYFRRTAFTADQWIELRKHAEESGLVFISSPFSLEAVDLLEDVGLDRYKVASGEVTNIPLLERIASTGKPIYLSSGMSSWEELDTAVEILRSGGPLTVLQCSSIYPCPPQSVGLNVIPEMIHRYKLPVGFSDHTLGLAAPLAATALGSVVVEKHLTFSRRMYGSDASHSVEPGEFHALAIALAELRSMLANPIDKDDTSGYIEMKQVFEKSIVAATWLPAGTTLEARHLAYKKPGDGVSPARYQSVLGRSTLRDIPADTQIREEDFE